MTELEKLNEIPVYHYFLEISKIPRGSGNREAIAEYVAKTLRELGAESYIDREKNVIARVKASEGCENAPVVMLQGHLDMVAEKDECSDHDFRKDPLHLILEGDNLHADHTTLGADDGTAVALMMALAGDRTLVHPELELVFTSDEETGMDGAMGLDLSASKAKYLLNLDNESEAVFTVSCAGGARFNGEIPLAREEKTGTVYEIEVRSKVGGHSGTEIHWDRPNTNMVAAELLLDLFENDAELGFLSIRGGLADNAIPMRTVLCVMTEKPFDLPALEAKYRQEYATTDDNVTFTILSKKPSEKAAAVTGACLKNLIEYAVMLPNGTIDFNHEIKDLTETSLNFGIFETTEDRFIARTCVRSSVESKKERLLKRLSFMTEKCGGTWGIEGSHPGWAYKKDSKFRDEAVRLWNEMYPENPAKVVAIHAGLECGILLDKKPDLDIIAIGPTAHAIHTPKETLSVSSVARVEAFVKRFLSEIAKW